MTHTSETNEAYEAYEQLLVRMILLRHKIEGNKKELRDVRREMAKKRRTWKPKAVRP